MNFEEERQLACANHLGIAPERISRTEVVTDGGGHFEGIEVVIFIPTGRRLGRWIEEKLAPATTQKAYNTTRKHLTKISAETEGS